MAGSTPNPHTPRSTPAALRTISQSEYQSDQAIALLIREIESGLAHGFFDYRLHCELTKGSKRCLTIQAGKSHQFVIPEEEVS